MPLEDVFLGEARQLAEACAKLHNEHKAAMVSIENGCMQLLMTLIIWFDYVSSSSVSRFVWLFERELGVVEK
jgi:hypothetical protein